MADLADAWDGDYRDVDAPPTRAAHCPSCRKQAWVRTPAGTWRCLDCGNERPDRPLVSDCCEARLVRDSTRTFCAQCGACLEDLNAPDVRELHLVACTDCGGNGYAGGIDDLNCETCKGEGLVET